MAVKIKLKRLGKIHAPQYRIVVADARTARNGRAIEELGIYQPMDNPSVIKVDSERVQYWLGVGAQPTDRVARFLDAAGIRERAARNNPKKGELGTNAKQRIEEKAAKLAAAEEAKKQAEEEAAAAAAAAAEAAAAPAEEAPAAEEAAAEAPAEAAADEQAEG